MTHISYEVSKKLKEFLGESAPEPMEGKYLCEELYGPTYTAKRRGDGAPAYQLHDLLSKPFCEAMAKKVFPHGEVYLAAKIFAGYYNGGLPAVEKALMEMMEGK